MSATADDMIAAGIATETRHVGDATNVAIASAILAGWMAILGFTFPNGSLFFVFAFVFTLALIFSLFMRYLFIGFLKDWTDLAKRVGRQ